jgi:hypothetical protein
MKSKLTLFLCVALVIALSVMLTTAVPPADNLPEQAPLQTCVEGESICIGNNSYECAFNNQWLLKEANSEAFCDYEAPTVCTGGEAMCFGFNNYTCLNNEWVLTALNDEGCGYVCTSGASYCDGVDFYLCMNNEWSVTEDSPSCGYVAPAEVQTNILTNYFDYLQACDIVLGYYAVPVELGGLKTVTLHSGGVSGGIYWDNGGVPGVAYVSLLQTDVETYNVSLPLYSEVSFENIDTIILVNTFPPPPGCGDSFDEYRINIGSNIVYSVS